MLLLPRRPTVPLPSLLVAPALLPPPTVWPSGRCFFASPRSLPLGLLPPACDGSSAEAGLAGGRNLIFNGFDMSVYWWPVAGWIWRCCRWGAAFSLSLLVSGVCLYRRYRSSACLHSSPACRKRHNLLNKNLQTEHRRYK